MPRSIVGRQIRSIKVVSNRGCLVMEDFVSEAGLFVVAIGSGLLIRMTLSLVGQTWSRTYSNTVTYLLLPVVGLVIVQVISNSIALSLGMIGALSIVRFRHPVKSPLELVVYFLLLTIGVSLTTRPLLGVALTLTSCLVILAVSMFQRWRSRRGFAGFPVSPGDGESTYVLEIESTQAVDLGDVMDNLLMVAESPTDSRFSYRLGFASRSDAEGWRSQFLSRSGVTEIRGVYA